jgi:hypothetical protein
VTQHDDGADSADDIQRQFAQLQAEMKRVMAEPQATGDAGRTAGGEAADFARIKQGLDALRRDADRLRARMTTPAEDVGEAMAALRARTEEIARQSAEIGKRAEDSAAKLTRAVQGNRETLDDMALRLDSLAQRQPGRWLVPLAIVFGAAIIAAAVMLDEPGRIERLIERISATLSPPKPHAEDTQAAPAVATLPLAEPAKVAEAPPPPADPAPPVASAEEPPPVVQPVAAAGAPTPPDPPAPHGRIVLRAKGDAWVEVRNHQGAALLARLMRDGETWPVPDQSALLLSTGNAGGVELLVDGTPAPALGGAGAVRRDVPLDADLVRTGHYAPDPAARQKPAAASR